MTRGRVVVLDVGETLIDETPLWTEWAEWLSVPRFTLFAMIGGMIALGRSVEELNLPVYAVTSSGDLGAAKPAPEFFRRLAAVAGAEPERCVHVCDRLDNDVIAAREAGMTAVWLRRGPWAHLQADPLGDGGAAAVIDSLDDPAPPISPPHALHPRRDTQAPPIHPRLRFTYEVTPKRKIGAEEGRHALTRAAPRSGARRGRVPTAAPAG